MTDDELAEGVRARLIRLTAPDVPFSVVERRAARSNLGAATGIALAGTLVVVATMVIAGGLREQGVGGPLSAGPVATPRVVTVAVPHVIAGDPDTQTICNDMLLVGRLRGAEADPRAVWVENPSGTRVDLAWPAGFSARFAPGLELADARGAVVARGGDEVRLGGSYDATGTVFGVCTLAE
jgi:hypothetical protein